MSAARKSSPNTGELAQHPLPRLLLGLWRRGFTGRLRLTQGDLERRFVFRSGAPVSSDANRGEDGLGRQLVSSRRIDEADFARLVAHCEKQKVPEGAGLLALKLIEPKDLVLAIREQISRRMVDAFGWSSGRFALDDGPAPGEVTTAFGVDPLQILQDGLGAYWRADRILADLAEHLDRFAAPGERFATLAARLRPGPDREAVTAALDPTRPFGEALGGSRSPARLAVAWTLAESGALEFSDSPPAASDEAEPAADTASRVHFEIEVRRAASGARDAGEQPVAASVHLPSPAAEALRKDVLALHERLDELDHYEVLGVEAKAPDAAVKKAYFAAAKRFHPDAVTRLGVDSIHREANEVFARIAQAYQTLSNPSRRKEYDHRSSRGGKPSTDANRVAQAETLFRKGEVMVKVGNFGSALDFLRPCVELWPEEADYQGLLGWALYKHKPSDPERARRHLEKADALRPDDPLILFRLGTVLRKLGEVDAAQIYLDRSKSLEREAKR